MEETMRHLKFNVTHIGPLKRKMTPGCISQLSDNNTYIELATKSANERGM